MHPGNDPEVGDPLDRDLIMEYLNRLSQLILT